MKKKKNIPIGGKKMTPMQSVQLALAFVGEHKELFEVWIKSKGGEVKHE